MTTQGQKTPFQGEKTPFSAFFLGKNGCFLVLAGLKTLLYGFHLTKHVRFRVQHPQNGLGGPAGDHPGPENTV